MERISLRVLIADKDFNSIEDVIFAIIQHHPDWVVSFTASGKECLNRLKNGDCHDVAILGVELPDMSDFKLVEQVREYSDIPIIVLSADNDIYMLVGAFDAGASDYIVKPFDNRMLIARLKALKRRRDWDIEARRKKTKRVTSSNITKGQ